MESGKKKKKESELNDTEISLSILRIYDCHDLHVLKITFILKYLGLIEKLQK